MKTLFRRVSAKYRAAITQLKTKSWIFIAPVLAGFLIIGWLAILVMTPSRPELVVPRIASLNQPSNIFKGLANKPPPALPPSIDTEILKKEIEQIINQDVGYWAVVSGSLKNPTILVNQTQVFTAASLMKVLVAEYTLQQVEQGQITLEQKIKGKTIEELLTRMVNRSDNPSWYILNDYFTYTALQLYARDRGLLGTNVYNNTITAEDIAKLLADIYFQNSLNPQNSQKLLELMEDTETESRIPAALPEDTTVYHKAAYWEGATHDAAIIETPHHGPIVLVLMSQGSEHPVAMMKKITKTVAAEYWKT